MNRIIATFHPQAWVNKHAVDVDPQGECSFDVTDVVVALSESVAPPIRDYNDSSDDLASLPSAPEWVRNWPGPFYVTVEQSIQTYFDARQVVNA
jgi:hypothetical protein